MSADRPKTKERPAHSIGVRSIGKWLARARDWKLTREDDRNRDPTARQALLFFLFFFFVCDGGHSSSVSSVFFRKKNHARPITVGICCCC